MRQMIYFGFLCLQRAITEIESYIVVVGLSIRSPASTHMQSYARSTVFMMSTCANTHCSKSYDWQCMNLLLNTTGSEVVMTLCSWWIRSSLSCTQFNRTTDNSWFNSVVRRLCFVHSILSLNEWKKKFLLSFI